MKVYKCLALNFGSTSSKVAYFENDQMLIKETLSHSQTDLNQFKAFWDQEEYRSNVICEFMDRYEINADEIDVFVCWGGHCESVSGGVYLINDKFLDEVKSMKYGHHPGDLAPFVAKRLSKNIKLAITVDPPTIDEFQPLARYTGLPEISRKSRMQTLNQKAVARKYAQDIGKSYEELNLIVTHMGGGISVVVHENGKMIDANNGLDGEGPYASNRSGTIPAKDLVELCFSKKYSEDEIKKLITGQGGLIAHLNESDTRIIERRINEGDHHAKEVYDGMIYQIAKQIGANAAVLCGKVDAILLTGGIANSAYVIDSLNQYVSFIAPIKAYPGELEMESLGQSAYRVMINEESIKEI